MYCSSIACVALRERIDVWLRNRPKGARFASFGVRSLHLRIDADGNRLSGYRLAAGAAARRRRTLAEAGVLRRLHHPGRDLRVRPSDRHFFAASRDLSSGQPRHSGHRHHRLDHAQSARRAAAALSGLRFPQGRSHAEGRSARHCCRREPAAPPSRATRTEDPVDIQCLGEGRKNRRPRHLASARRSIPNCRKRSTRRRLPHSMSRCRSKRSRSTT